MNRTILKAVVLSISLLLMSAPAVSPALANISAAFTTTNPSTIMLIVSMPSITVAIFCLVYGKLAAMMRKRTILGIAAVCFFIGGTGPAFLNDMTSILIMRGIFGISMGFLMPLSTVLITDFFEGAERQSMMGWQSATINIGGIIFPLLAGVLCAIDWHYTFYVYVLGIAIFAFVFFFLPEPARLAPTSEDQGQQTKRAQLSVRVWLLELSLFVYMLASMAFMSNLAMKIVQERLGDAASTGFALAVFTGGGLLAGLFFGKITQKLDKFTVSAGWIASGVGLALLASVQNFDLVVAGCFISGMGYAVMMPGTFVQISTLAAPPAIAFGFAIAYSVMGVGQFVAPLIFEFVDNLFGRGPGSFPILVGGSAMLCIGLLLLLGSVWSPKADKRGTLNS